MLRTLYKRRTHVSHSSLHSFKNRLGPVGWTGPTRNRWGIQFGLYNGSVVQVNRCEPVKTGQTRWKLMHLNWIRPIHAIFPIAQILLHQISDFFLPFSPKFQIAKGLKECLSSRIFGFHKKKLNNGFENVWLINGLFSKFSLKVSFWCISSYSVIPDSLVIKHFQIKCSISFSNKFIVTLNRNTPKS